MPTGARRFLPALPTFSFMAFAPLDAWLRVLTAGRNLGPIPPRYWPRAALGLATSALGTVLTLPERIALAPMLPKPRGGTPSDAALGGVSEHEGPPILFVLGYYRSGTTHLHYLLSCDPGVITPKWYQMLAPQGFQLSWTLLRFLLVPFLSSKRPQDDVAYGPEYPAEDDFGVCNWTALGTMPGRMVVPARWEHYRRFHTLEGLSAAELQRFAQAQAELTWKLERIGRGRALLLKTPAHTARVAELVRLYGPRARFIHLHREPASVLRSNVAMHRRFEPFLLQDHPGDDAIRSRIIDEYDRTERKFLLDASRLPEGGRAVVSRIRYEDLIADPVGEIDRAYRDLGLVMTPAFAARLVGYLRSVESYRAAGQKTGDAGDGRDRIAPAPELAWMNQAFGHDAPAAARRAPAERARELVPGVDLKIEDQTGTPTLMPALVAMAIALVFTAAWLFLASTGTNRHDWLVWPLGILVGIGTLKAAGRGSPRLGWIAGAIVLTVFLARALPATYLSEPRYHHPSPDRLFHIWRSTYDGVVTVKNGFWLVLGVMTAARFASREHLRPPGL